ncbi:helix-turn-helix transcriptional regulator [Tepidimonas ignava]|uniref:helix-turn-helix domain-containing protein n=1 Tax=Tepidimonas ignava TaxID=114249 RepID=UPI002FD8EB7B
MNGKPEDTIGSRLRQWRITLGLTQAQLAERLGVHIGVLKKYEQGLNVPGGEALAAIARTGVNMTWLLTGEGEMLPVKPEKTIVNQQDGESLDALAGRHARRWAKIIQIVESAPTPEEAEAAIDELFARAKERIELAELRQAVRDLTANLQKRA